MEKYTLAELVDKIQETTRRAGGEVSNDPRAMQAWRERERELRQQLWDQQYGHSDPP